MQANEQFPSRRKGATRPRLSCLGCAGRIVLGLITILVIYYASYLLLRGPRLTQPQVIAHRGDSANAPENTLVAFRRAVEMGAGWLEMDVQRTADGALVVIHDETVDRTTGGVGRVADLTLEQIRSLDAGGGERVPTFDEVIQLAQESGVGIFPEAKSPQLYPGLEDEIAAALLERDYLRQAVLQSFEHPGLEAVSQSHPDLLVCPLYGLWDLSLGRVKPADAETVCPMVEMVLLNPWMVRRAHQDGRLVYAWFGAIENPWAMRLALALGVDGLMVDDPGVLAAILE